MFDVHPLSSSASRSTNASKIRTKELLVKDRASSRIQTRWFCGCSGVFALVVAVCALSAQGQVSSPDAWKNLTVSTTATDRFVAVHGQRGVVMGYPQQGLEIWVYPFQILERYQIGIRPEGSESETDGRLLLRRLIYEPASVTRIYVGPDYVVREKIFVPIDQPNAIITYQVESQHPVDIVIHFTPVLNLMWPGAIGGQHTQWNAAASGYVLGEPLDETTAVVASPEVVAHDTTGNDTLGREGRLSFSIRPRSSTAGATKIATLFVALKDKQENPANTIQTLAAQAGKYVDEADVHYQQLAQDELRIQTPDAEVNAAIAWSQIDLDQSWVCNPRLGCGIVAGYGPSRAARRPQYDWFFAGDGLVATNALISASDYSRARDELVFILKYQDANTGMVWHELSQSAGYIDWSKYPYMFVHVDITFDFLSAFAHYVQASGDTQFARDHWPSIARAYSYCRSIIDPADHLPHIPAGKEGGDEQHRPADDLGLSVSWADATQSFAQLAETLGHHQESTEAESESQLARVSIARHYWDAKQNYWIDGHTADGSPIFTRHSGPGEALTGNIFTEPQSDAVLDQVASSKFRTDWGVRGVSKDSPIYDPWSYATGSISALHSLSTATVFWQQHRPEVAEAIWRSILPWTSLDSPGHIHEVLAGNYYREQSESVPEQTWSSAGFLDATVRGLLGLKVDAAQNSVTLQPRLPADWGSTIVEDVKLLKSELAFTIGQERDEISLDVHNQGSPVNISFVPRVPLGAQLTSAECDGHKVQAKPQSFDQDDQAAIGFEAQPGVTSCHLHLTGGVSVILPQPAPKVGDPSTGMILDAVHLQNRTLEIDAEVTTNGEAVFRIQTAWKPGKTTGAVVHPLSDNVYEVQLPMQPNMAGGYKKLHAEINFIN